MQTLVLKAFLMVLAAAECVRAMFFLSNQPIMYELLGRDLIDSVVSRQFGLFLLPAVVFYTLVALDPARFGWMLWVGVIQHGAEAGLALSDLAAGLLSAQVAISIVAIQIVLACVLALICWRSAATPTVRSLIRRRRWMRRILFGFGGLFLFWAIASSVFVPVGSWLLNYPINDLYITKQQGIGFLVLSMTSLFVTTNVERYRRFIWVPVSSQMTGVFNAIYEVQIGTIPLQGAVVQWVIQAIIITLFVSFYPWKISHRSVSQPLEDGLRQPLH